MQNTPKTPRTALAILIAQTVAPVPKRTRWVIATVQLACQSRTRTVSSNTAMFRSNAVTNARVTGITVLSGVLITNSAFLTAALKKTFASHDVHVTQSVRWDAPVPDGAAAFRQTKNAKQSGVTKPRHATTIAVRNEWIV